MVTITVAAALFIALTMGAAGDFVAWVVSWAGLGAWIGCFVSLIAERRIRRRRPAIPWMDSPPIAADRYLRMGSLIGGVVGLTLALVDAGLLG